MNDSWDWPGSRWWRVDLHAHSPASHDFQPKADRETRDWKRWIEATRDAGIQAVAITDHNSAEAVDELQQAAAAVDNAPVLFPGVEITAVDGTHLLFILPPEDIKANVEDLLSKAEVPVQQRGTDQARSQLSVGDLLNLAKKGGLLCLGAHVNAPKGLLKLEGQQRIDVLKNLGLAAVEIDPDPSQNPEVDKEFDEKWLDGSHPEIRRELPQVWSSDSHSFDQMGRRFTWIKMTRPNSEGLHLALLDGSDSLMPARKTDESNPNQHPNMAIESITVRKAKFMGRPEPLTVPFNPWLNAIIGGRGTGKSTLVDFCRKTLRREDELPTGGDASLRAVFDRRLSASTKRGEEGLLTAETSIEVVYRKAGERFVLAWDQRATEQSISLLEGDQRSPEEGRIHERFPVRIYSQKQLFDLATQPNALLTVIDDADLVDSGSWRRKRKEAEVRYLSLMAEARDLRTQADDLPNRQATLSDLHKSIAIFEKGGNAQALNDYRTRRNQENTWQSIRTNALEGVDAVEKAAQELSVPDLKLSNDSQGDSSLAALERTHESLRTAVGNLQKTVLAAIENARMQIDGIHDSEDAKTWQTAMNASEDAFQQVSAELGTDGNATPDEYRNLLQRATTLKQEIATLEHYRETASEREKEASAALIEVRELRYEHGKSRKSFAEKTSGDLIQVGIRINGQDETLEQFLRVTLGFDRFESDFRALCSRIGTASNHSWHFSGLDDCIQKIHQVLEEPDTKWDELSVRFVTRLRNLQPERLDRLALYLPDDAVEVRFRDPRDSSKKWKELAQGSPGQKTAALLAFVLGYGNEPIILDQPEDDLDNTLIYDLLVKRLRETKASRQIIVVTHNPNIVVHGDAELVVSLEAVGGQTHIAFAGGLQEQKGRDEICRVMEGGRRAFETRYRRIMSRGGQDHF